MRTIEQKIRQARPDEAGRIRAMQEFSFHVLGSSSYAPELISAFIHEVGTLDQTLIEEGHYFVIADERDEILATGGWSCQKPVYAGVLPSNPDAAEAVVRAVYVAPAVARCGLGSALMRHIENDAAAAGIVRLRLAATLSGFPLYARMGYRRLGARRMELSNGLVLDCVGMEKELARAGQRLEAGERMERC